MKMEDNAAALHTVQNAIQALGKGFDVNYDTRLLYCKGLGGNRVVEVDEDHTRDLQLFEGLVVPKVSRDVRCSPDGRRRENTVLCSFHEMAEYFNQKALLSGNVPLGSFNAAFSFTGSKELDASSTKSLAMDGMFISLCKVLLMKFPFSLLEDVKRAVPLSWEPSSLASFIETYGTHVITSVTIGGKDAVDPGLFNSQGVYPQPTNTPYLTGKEAVDPGLFNSQGVYPQPTNTPYLTGKEDVTVIFRRRGGDDLVQSHTDWARTVYMAPDVIEMGFYPITSLLDGVPGKDHLTRALTLYLEYKPSIEELRYFLEFQIPRIWAPIKDNLPGHQRRDPVCPSLQFSMMGQKLYVSQEQVSVGRKPVTGLRLSLEGIKQNRLCIHVQHLASLPNILQPHWDMHVAIGAPKWCAPEEQDSRWFEPVRWKNFSHVSTAPVENNETFIRDLSGVHIVTGAQLGVWDFGTKNVLYMKLLYSKVPGCTIRRSLWDHSPGSSCDQSKRPSIGDSKEPSESSSGLKDSMAKLTKLVDLSEVYKGPQDSPGHWVVSGGKLGVDKGKIVLRVKYSLLNY
ncbi:hypothetical protein Taro_008409 [Colocasia esculenta]|uniref:MACPF domain-containing protein n=1 Tax=Colocasia esculenta TaxID=4460 RepID=A0A843U1S0_COLES|nr:hypothetical protein [Colocasia esculenta]